MTAPAHASAPGADPIKGVLARCLARVESRFRGHVESDLPPVQALCEHVERYRGKMLRPTLLLLSAMTARAAGPDDPDPDDDLVSLAAVCEMVHMATLVHDDVLDLAETRRSGVTVNRLRGNEAAVLLGDYLFSSAFRLCSSISGAGPGRGPAEAAMRIGRTGMTLCEGELLQLHHRGNFSLDVSAYFEIVRRKTAALIGTACYLGAWHAGGNEATAAAFESFGLDLGVAFQIQDDVLDLSGDPRSVGKPLDRDVQLGKMTLPIIHHLAESSPDQRAVTMQLLGAQGGQTGRSPDPAALRGCLTRTGSLGFAREEARSLAEKARRRVQEFPRSEARDALTAMAVAVVERTH